MYKILISIIVGSVIGWITNALAIRMLFRPIKPIEIKLLGLEIQGLLPKRRKEIAAVVGETVEKELINFNEIFEEIVDHEGGRNIITMVKIKISENVNNKLPPFVPQIIRSAITQYVEEQIDKEAPKMLDDLINNIYEKTSKKIKIANMIEDKINSLDMEKIEEITLKIANKELKYIEVLGGILGGLIGLFQGVFIYLFV